jgi:hypothetical protein
MKYVRIKGVIFGCQFWHREDYILQQFLKIFFSCHYLCTVPKVRHIVSGITRYNRNSFRIFSVDTDIS